MDFTGTDRRLSDFPDADLTDMLDQEMDIFNSTAPAVSLDQYSCSMDNDWLDRFFEDDPVLNDKMMSEALQPPQVRSDHSYSLHKGENGRDSPLNLCKADLDTKEELDLEFLTTTSVPQTATQTQPQVTYAPVTTAPVPGQSLLIKREPALVATDLTTAGSTLCTQAPTSSAMTQVVKQPTIILTTQTPIQHPLKQERLVLPKVSIKVEPESSPEHTVNYEALGLPPTPPSSNTSDSEGSLSPNRSAPSSPLRHSPYSRPQAVSAIRSLTPQPLFTSPIPQTGVLILTEEEKRTLIQEGYPIPTKLPLTKQEEKNLKKIRRKIKNKISAQESRRKKKEYLESLERRVESFNQENTDLRKKVEHLENNNRSLLSQLQKLQSLVGKVRPSSPSSTQTGTCVMVLVLCFAIFLGGWSPLSLMNIGYSNQLPAPVKPQPIRGQQVPMGPEVKDAVVDAYTTPSVRSRMLLSIKEDMLEDEQFGPHTPFSYRDMFISIFRGNQAHQQQEEPRTGSLKVEPPVPCVNKPQQVKVKVDHTVTITAGAVKKAMVDPDVATNISASLISVEQQVNTTA